METQAQVDELKGIMVRNIGMFHGIVCITHVGKNNNRLLDWGQIILERLKQHFLILAIGSCQLRYRYYLSVILAAV